MKMYDAVTIVCDQMEEHSGNALRGMLEAFRLRVKLHVCVWESHLTDFLHGKVPFESEYLILIAPGWGPPDAPLTHTEREDIEPGEMGSIFHCVKEMPDKSWTGVEYVLRPPMIRESHCFKDKRIVFCGCGSGRKAYADAFLAGGAASYMGVFGEVDGKAMLQFATGFFYHLLAGEGESVGQCDERTAFERAAAIDKIHEYGTHRYRYYVR